MLQIFLILILIRPFIASLAYAYANPIYSFLLLGFLALWVAKRGVRPEIIIRVKYPLILFSLAIIICLVFSQDKITSLKELYKYTTAVILFLVGASLNAQGQKQAITCLIISGLAISILAGYQYFFGFGSLSRYLTEQNIANPFFLDYIARKRVFYPFVTPNTLAGYLIMIIPLTLTSKHKLALITPLLLALILTKSIGALLSLLAALAIYFFNRHSDCVAIVKRASLRATVVAKQSLFLIFGLLTVIGFALLTRSATLKEHTQPVFSMLMRLNYWQESLKIIQAHPFAGIGLGNFNLAQSRYAHNSYLQIWAETGILGLIAILWLSYTALFKSALRNPFLISAAAAFLAHNFVDFTFFLPEVSSAWWLILGMAAAASYPESAPCEANKLRNSASRSKTS